MVAVEKIVWDIPGEGRPTGDNVWSVTSSSHPEWRSVHIPLNENGASIYRLVFVGEGRGHDGFIRVDDIQLSGGPCQPKGGYLCTLNPYIMFPVSFRNQSHCKEK